MKRFLWFVVLLLWLPSFLWAGSQQTSSTLASSIIADARYLLNESADGFWTDADEMLQWTNDAQMDVVARTRCLESTENITLTSDTVEYSISGSYIAVTAVVFQDCYTLDDLTYDSTSNPDTITTAAGNFTDAGFEAADAITVSGSESNNDTYTIVSMTDTVLTLADGALSADEGSADADGIFTEDASTRATGDGLPFVGLQRGLPQMLGQVRTYQDVTCPSFWYEWNGKIGIIPTPGDKLNNKRVIVYFIARPTALSSTSSTITTPAHYDHALALYVASRALQRDRRYGESARLMAEYIAELDRFRADFDSQAKEADEVSK